MRLAISIQPFDFIFGVQNGSLWRGLEEFKCEAPRTRSALSVILAEVGPVEAPEIRWVGLLGWVFSLAMGCRRRSSRPHRAWTSPGVQRFYFKKAGSVLKMPKKHHFEFGVYSRVTPAFNKSDQAIQW